MNLENKRVKLRKLKISDAEFICRNAKDRKITKYSFVIPPPFTLKEAEKFIRKTQQEAQKKIAFEFGIELKETEELVGTINLLDINYKNKNANIGFWLAKKYWGKEISDEAVKLMLEFGFKKLKLKRIQARVLHKNIRAQKLLERLSFKLEGRLRKKTFFRNQWSDDLIYGLLKEDYR